MAVNSPTMGDYEERDENSQFVLQQISGQQYSLHEALHKVDQKLANMYLGALMAFHSKNPDYLAQAAHSLRELMEKLPEKLDLSVKVEATLREKVNGLVQVWQNGSKQIKRSGISDDFVQKFLVQWQEFYSWKETNLLSRRDEKLKTLRRLDPLGFPYIGIVSKLWVDQWMDCHRYFQSVAHHGYVPTDDEFASQVSKIEQFLLDRLYPRTFEDYTKLDELIREGEECASQELVNRVIATIKRTADYEYFFEQITSPNWLPFLQEAGLFKSPPLPEPFGDGLYVLIPAWPASRYLVRMAPSTPKWVLKSILDIPETVDNFRVIEDIVGAACLIPGKAEKELVSRIMQWANMPYLDLLSEKFGAFVLHLVQGGQARVAYDLASTLLTSLAKSNTWRYEQLLQKFLPLLLQHNGMQFMRSLCDLLSTTLASSYEGAEEPQDYSYIWRPAIENSTQQEGLHKLRDVLISAVRDVAERIVRENKGTVQDMVHLLEEYSWPVFRRMDLYLLYVFADAVPELVIERLTNRQLFETLDLRHEYVRLAQKCFAGLPRENQETILNWGEEPSLPLFDEQQAEEALSLRDLQRGWRWTHFAAFSQAVPETLRSHHLWLNELKPSRDAEFPVLLEMREWSDPPSPIAIESLQSMRVEDIITFLSEWQPSGGIDDPSPESLGRTLTRAIKTEPTHFAEGAEQFRGVHPTYIYAVLLGFAADLEEHQPFPWRPVLNLCAWIVEQSETAPHKLPGSIFSHVTWNSCRLQITTLLTRAFEQDQEIPFSLRLEVWKVIRPLTSDPNPTPEDESSHNDPHTTPISLCGRTIRGAAMQTTIWYALWVKRHLEQGEDEHAAFSQNFDAMPEVRKILERHLDPASDPSLAIRSVYGRYLHKLVHLDEQWVSQWVTTIFPREESLHPLRGAAWDAYLIFCTRLSPQVFHMLRDEYSHAIAETGTYSRKEQYSVNPDKRLVEHLVVLYWHGELDIQDTLFIQFFQQAPCTLHEHAITFIGQSLATTEVDSQLLQRLQVLWEWRVRSTRGATSPRMHNAELSAFGSWFVSRKFNDAWSITQLEEVLKFTDNVTPDFLVVRSLAKLPTTLLWPTIRCLGIMVKGSKERWRIDGWLGDVRTILDSGLKSTDEVVHQATVDLIHELGARGYREFRRML